VGELGEEQAKSHSVVAEQAASSSPNIFISFVYKCTAASEKLLFTLFVSRFKLTLCTSKIQPSMNIN
jgi:hypothetical protein